MTMTQPGPAEIKEARKKAKITQREAADMVYVNIRQWQRYEQPEDTANFQHIPLGLWELFLLKTGQRELVTRQ